MSKQVMGGVMHTKEHDKLAPCPFCNGGETQVDESRLAPTMQGPGAIISAYVKHWCNKPGNGIRSYLEFAGRDKESAISLWNKRSSVTGVKTEDLPGAVNELVAAMNEILTLARAFMHGDPIPFPNKIITHAQNALLPFEGIKEGG